jgi:drug/metabolite transporter (DMT)-like permease
MSLYIGELAAIFTSVCWTISATVYSYTGDKIGAQVVNRLRLLVAILMLVAINWIFYGQPLPLQAGSDRWIWLSLSGIVGLAIGDAFLFQSYSLIGARMGLLLLSLSPVFSTLIAWLFLGETLTPIQLGGMVLALGGISWVIFAKRATSTEDLHPRKVFLGVLFGVLAAVGQAGGLVLSRQGIQGGFPPFAGTLIRMIAAFISLWLLAVIQKKAVPTLVAAYKNPRISALVFFGSIFGPVVGVSLSLLAVQYAKLGIASTLMALPPVLMMPVSYFFFHEKFGWQAILGTIITVAGVAALFLT